MPDDERTVAQLVVEQAEFADLVVLDPAGADDLGAPRAPTPCSPGSRRDARACVAESTSGCAPDRRRARRGRPAACTRRCSPAYRRSPPTADVAAHRCSPRAARSTPAAARRARPPARRRRPRPRPDLARHPPRRRAVAGVGGRRAARRARRGLARRDDEAWAGGVRSAARRPRWAGTRASATACSRSSCSPTTPTPTRSTPRSAAPCSTDAELAAGADAWGALPDPFGWWHADPCDDIARAPQHSGNPDAGEITP